MTRILASCLAFIALGVAPTWAQKSDVRTPPRNQLTPAETAARWKLLFDGQSTDAWRGYRLQSFPEEGWLVEDGCLKTAPAGRARDIITTAQYGDFELYLEWSVPPHGNSGIMYRVIERHDHAWQTGPEYQILDDAAYGYPPTGTHSAGALYDLYPPSDAKRLAPVGQFNQSRIRLKDGHLKHWLNGVKVVDCRIDTDEWKRRIAGSKFARYDGFGVQPQGHIALQHHGDAVSFRNIKIRDLSAPMPNEIRLFNGRDLSGWRAYLSGDAQMQDVWRVSDGVLICRGNPAGYIYTEDDYTNYVLKLEWRFDPAKGAGNSGVLLRLIGEHKVWPRSVEAQLQSGNAGDFWNIDKFPMKTDPQRTRGRNTKKTHFAEYPLGEWNEYEIIVDGGAVILSVNGEELNRAGDVWETPGKIGLQSEGAEIHFRNIRLAPIKR
jgi:hypothetical protein